MYILIFFIGHWFLSLFVQTFFLHRYASHKVFSMNTFWEKTFYLLTYLFQGSSFLKPFAYATMHRDHHAFSDTEKDPHSPHFFRDVFQMTRATVLTFRDHMQRSLNPAIKLAGNYPQWRLIDRIGSSIPSRIIFGAAYTCFYIAFAGYWWMFLLLPIHFLMGPLHGAIVNWCGHKYGYSNFNNDDHSKNTSPLGFLMLGELFQNNHHRHPNSANFAHRWFEFDPVYPVLKLLHCTGVIRLKKA
ncbi:acyl-CoA desaturase [Pedobacter sp. BS3]|uniref:acyl-CoA desaturase n=1 Tax=Pedobacter sp. BS3 TaxID=2567937 RepID=UPI0011EBA371|nr:acyl-CoA desaturase [Pedobacter sp. BS3]TZF83109.1 acyl-CoA desaturase [Pedobacter sp. BS3]